MTNVPPLVSVIMIFLDAERFLAEAIDSVLAQTQPNWELILVDDGSTDASGQIAAEYAARYPARIRVINHPGGLNCGIAASRNLGMTVARGRYLAFLDADDVYEPGRLEQHVRCLERDPTLGVVLSPEIYWRNWQASPPGTDTIQDQVIAPAADAGRPFAAPALIVATLLTTGAPMPGLCSITFRAAAFRELGGIPEQFRGHYEDQVLICKLLLAYPARVLDEPLARYRQHPESLTEGNAPQVEQALGANWAGNAPIMQIMAIAGVTAVFGEIVVPLLMGRGRADQAFVLEIVQTGVLLVVLLPCLKLLAVPGAALAWLLGNAASMVLAVVWAQRLLPGALASSRGRLVATPLIAVVMAGVASVASAPLDGIAGLIAGGVAGTLAGLAALWALDRTLNLQLGQFRDLLVTRTAKGSL